ncbi:MAG: hypothetical protein WD824_03345 [Cyclobacteriaceae bacterium]
MTAKQPILLLLLFGIIIFPWQIFDFCVTHPLGHNHGHHDGPSPCEIRKQFKGTAYWPPMDCFKISTDADDFQQPEKVKPTVSGFAVIAIFFEVIQVTAQKQTFTLLLDIGCNSDPPLRVNALRGPPLV